MHGLARFDALLARHHHEAPRTTTPSRLHRASLAARVVARQRSLLIDPWGDVVATLPPDARPAQVLAAAWRLQRGDWMGVLADDGAVPRGGRAGWRLALLRGRVGAGGSSLQWLSPTQRALAGVRSGELLQRLQEAALAELWRQGWRLQA